MSSILRAGIPFQCSEAVGDSNVEVEAGLGREKGLRAGAETCPDDGHDGVIYFGCTEARQVLGKRAASLERWLVTAGIHFSSVLQSSCLFWRL